MRRALVSLPDGVWKIIDTQLKGQLGDGDSEVIRNIVVAHLMEKGYLLPAKKGTPQIGQIADELGIQDTMIQSLVELLEEKGQIRYSDWENRIQKKIRKPSK